MWVVEFDIFKAPWVIDDADNSKGGSIVGGAINLAFNATGKTTGKLDYRTYIVFMAFQSLGPFVAILLSPPEKIQRQDGRKVAKAERIPTVSELKAVAKILIRKDFSLITANFISGNILEWKRFTINQRAKLAYFGTMALFGQTGFGCGWALYILLQVNFALAYTYGYWIAGYMARDNAEIIRFISTVRAVEAAGGAVASGISSTHAPLIAAASVNFGLWGLALIPTYFAVRAIDTKPTENLSEEELRKDVSV
ncbi:hypothetical protein CSAL01_09793 [Colletotrichum salicis]|uniref:Major facilitator superfamily transporter n=1 Tax=Colletotrichum salicis TaxID=1209931 RepID=A0A135UPM6_9PEZI|nr:hypothetical protein CSAL01_09793 [Colletotrichum salicis]